MTQATPIIGSDKSGLNYRTEDNDGKRALLNHHKGSIAPTYAEAGVIWLDDSATPWSLKCYDGADWISMGVLNASTNTFVSALENTAVTAGSYSAADITIDAQGRITAAADGSASSGLNVIAMCVLDGTGTPSFTLNSGFSSITDNGTGDYTLNFSSVEMDTNYMVMATGSGGVTYAFIPNEENKTTAGFDIKVRIWNGSLNQDITDITVLVWRI